MSSFIVVKVDGELPENIAIAASRVFGAVVEAWNVNGSVQPSSMIELLGFDSAPEGPMRRRKSVLDRLYADVEAPQESAD